MKPKIAALLLVALLVALASVIPAVTAQGVVADHPPTPAAPVPTAPSQPRQGQPGPAPVAPNAFTVSGKVTDVFDQPVADVQLDAYNTETWDYYTTTTNASGNYSFSLPAGDYEIVPYKNNWIFKPERIEVTVGPNKSNKNFEAVDASWQVNWYNAIADAYTNQASKTTNYGSAPILRVKNAASDMNAYVKFDVYGLAPETEPGTCFRTGDGWMMTYVKEPSSDGGGVYRVGNNWSETTLNWNNAPAITGEAIGQFYSVTDETNAWARLSHPADGDGVYSFAIRNNSSNSVDYSSWEGGNYPWLVVDSRIEYKEFLSAEISAGDTAGLAPHTVQFSAHTYGCPTSWYWEFGDGATSTEPNPSHTYTVPGNYDVSLTVSNGATSDTTWWYGITAATEPTQFFISPSGNATIGGIPAQGADVLLYDKPSNTWTMVYDGSNHGTLTNISAFSFDENDNLLLVFSANQVIPSLGTATSRDIVLFMPNVPGIFPLGTGTYAWYLRGSTPGVDLTTTAEAIDALDAHWDGVLVSTAGAASILTDPVLKAADEDVIHWVDLYPSWVYQMWLDGSTIPGLAGEDINGFEADGRTGDLYLTILGPFNLGGVTGNGKSIVQLTWDDMNGKYTPSLVPWLAPGATFPTDIDAIDIAWGW